MFDSYGQALVNIYSGLSNFIKIDLPTFFLICLRGLREVFRWVTPELRCALVIKNFLRAATLAC